jgi:WD40 repeat protein
LIRDLHAPSSSDTLSALSSGANSSPSNRDHINAGSGPFANCCRFIDDRQLVVAYADRSTAVHDVETGAHVRVIAAEASFSSNGIGSLSVAASLVGLGESSGGMGAGGLVAYDRGSGVSIFNNAGTVGQSAGAAESHTLAIVEAASPGAGASPLPSVIATAGSDGVVRVWDIRTDAGRAMRTFTGMLV